jgi:hypothetical protein
VLSALNLVDWHKNKTDFNENCRFGSSVGTLGVHFQLSEKEPGDEFIGTLPCPTISQQRV